MGIKKQLEIKKMAANKEHKPEKNFLPISIDIAKQKILIIGGGRSAYKKLQILKRFNADVEVLALKVCSEIKESGIKYYESEYRKEYLQGYLLVYSCTNDPVVDDQIVLDGKEVGVLVNIHDKPKMCQFVSPAIYKRDKLTVAVGSNGEDVFESIRIRDLIKNFLTEYYNKN